MFTAIITLLAASGAIAAPLTEVARGNKATPAHYAEGYLESYDQYHTRYLSIGCSGKQGTEFFNSCCRPLLSSQSTADQPSYCPAGFAASSSASSASSEAKVASAPASAAVAVAQPASSSAAAAPAWTPASSAAPAWTPASSAAPAPAATSKAPAPSNDQHTGGFATYFYQNGNPGACGKWNKDSDYGIAIDGNGFWQNYGVTSDHCGKQIKITNTKNGKSVTATVWDVCPTCVNDNSLDLSVGAFNAIATPDEGMVPISWSWA